ncbi:RNA methyltransferase [Salipaludibacillus sp. LMS25]|jgi:TrmH family RNA methyltransferase|uniref:TrmH family RNA methyltransferase n=1 Tax=Salipaludibacillus sp. LMS25 TaxID=2924031 RepID=UPI0020D02484|nr:RNA methyltransferase [Salipaludibacillus sp. LMS25]UTR15555.1 RNA methyltransferase [Salipaludibacillus sp. LMS25]
MEIIESVQNPKIKSWKKLHTKKERDNTGLFIIEGIHLIEEALKSDLVIEHLIIEEHKHVPVQWNVKELPTLTVTERVMREISETETPQGFAAVCQQPSNENLLLEEGKYLFVDAVQDPGNLGAMIRTADAAGISGIVLGHGTADPYNGKVIRSTQGSLFHLVVQKMDLEEAIDICQDNDIPVFGTSLQGSTYSAIAPQENFALIVGNEGSGVNKKLLERTNQNLYIPIFGEAESLNVAIATGILLYHLRGD